MKLNWSVVVLALCGLTACSSGSNEDLLPVEKVKQAPWREELVAEGEIKAAASTSLSVPGEGWDQRNLLTMVPNGSVVEKGQVIATFDAAESRIALSQAETDLLRKELGEAAVLAQANLGRAELNSESSKVKTDLDLSQRYANADLKIFAQNSILDKLVDIGFLTDKQGYLGWKKGQLGLRQDAEQAVINSQKESINLRITQKRKSLQSLQLVAPHAGVFILKPKWDGSLPQVGGRMWAGDEFGSLPDLGKQVARFSIAEGAAFGLKEGQKVKVRLAGTGTELDLKVSKVGKTASTKSKESPVKYSDFEVTIDEQLIKQHQLKPGQAVTAKVELLEMPNVISVPNIALIQEGADYFAYVGNGSSSKKRKLEVGLRGPIRTEIKSGLKVGEELVLTPLAKTEAKANDAAAGTKKDASAKEKQKEGKA
ncbi:HlyD family efflux transporter periplasmic adaptor subunit [Undibacterium cyanobacteriorum]|uniref:HlyD family efflux transporter periplasmic adaptor subunit n=1 Tax=Undibacterium cyanobacteriorum TaxID=3073561 RepID=A0ABY9RL91_9BURK|nr:biotin/lipoyl-binding protein [Undibacterium sp. 20NA77.5]WMW81721.1 HlyD family efflux transporter periplasmic adaptor subunit [Undibacterium sp. 20NA77.5]